MYKCILLSCITDKGKISGLLQNLSKLINKIKCYEILGVKKFCSCVYLQLHPHS